MGFGPVGTTNLFLCERLINLGKYSLAAKDTGIYYMAEMEHFDWSPERSEVILLIFVVEEIFKTNFCRLIVARAFHRSNVLCRQEIQIEP